MRELRDEAIERDRLLARRDASIAATLKLAQEALDRGDIYAAKMHSLDVEAQLASRAYLMGRSLL
ncbi:MULTISPECIES: hypothetical protein [Nocardia]|uniref:hypothetical protein n=1 Tax=Nocardia TaxID=1817 RepID=UPI0013001E2C|nr:MULTISPECIES: hypothetical protein [Nocardia]